MKAIFNESDTQQTKVLQACLSNRPERLTGTISQRQTVVRPLQHLHEAHTPVRSNLILLEKWYRIILSSKLSGWEIYSEALDHILLEHM